MVILRKPLYSVGGGTRCIPNKEPARRTLNLIKLAMALKIRCFKTNSSQEGAQETQWLTWDLRSKGRPPKDGARCQGIGDISYYR